jgi:multiple sugar transport system substrate-binding protein
MKFEKLYYVVISAVLIAVLFLVGYVSSFWGSPNSTTSSVKKIYYVDNISEAHKILIDTFNKRNKGQIEVEAIDLPFSKFSTNERKELLTRFLRSKNDRIDVFAVDQIWVPRFARWAMPIDKSMISPGNRAILSYAMKTCYYNGNLVALPSYLDVAMMYYRKDLLKESGNYNYLKSLIDSSITWEEMVKECHKGYAKNKPFFVFQGDDFEGLLCIFVEMLDNLGRPLMKNGELQLKTPEARKALQFLVDMVNSYGMSPHEVTNFRENPSYDFYTKNNGLFLRGWSSFVKDNYAATDQWAALSQIERAPLPHFAGSKPVSVFGGWNLMISSYSTKKQESIKFVNFLLSQEAQKIMYEKRNYIPVNENVYRDNAFVKKFPEIGFYKKLMKNGIYRPFLESYTTISDVLSYYLNLAIRKKIPVNEALSKASEVINSKSILLKL